MPIRNTLKDYDAPAYYHVYNRGAGGQPIYLDDRDRQKFLALFGRHLDPGNEDVRADGQIYEKYDIDLLAYCLMGNHFHLLVFQQTDPGAMTQLLRSVSTAYAMYFNQRHKKSGHLFQGIFKASQITSDEYLLHITRYIHLNPRSYLRYEWSSLRFYLGSAPPVWLKPDILNNMSPVAYRKFLDSYEGRKAELDFLKNQLANK